MCEARDLVDVGFMWLIKYGLVIKNGVNDLCRLTRRSRTTARRIKESTNTDLAFPSDTHKAFLIYVAPYLPKPKRMTFEPKVSLSPPPATSLWTYFVCRLAIHDNSQATITLQLLWWDILSTLLFQCYYFVSCRLQTVV